MNDLIILDLILFVIVYINSILNQVLKLKKVLKNLLNLITVFFKYSINEIYYYLN